MTVQYLLNNIAISFWSFVGRFMSRRERIDQMGDRAKKFTNVYVKNFGTALDDEKLKELFDPYGKIISCKVKHLFVGIG